MAFGDILSGLGNFAFGQSGQTQQFPRYTPEQQQQFGQAAQMGLAGLQQNPYNFEPIANQARTQFNTQTVPGLAERFTTMGGGQNSSAFQGALGSAASGLEENLAALKSQYGLQANNQLQSLLGLGLTQQYDTTYTPRQSGLFENLLTAGIGGLGNAAQGYFAGGGQLAGGIGSLLSNFQQQPQQQSAVSPQVLNSLVSQIVMRLKQNPNAFQGVGGR